MDTISKRSIFESRIEAAKNDDELLERIEEELSVVRGVTWAVPLRMRVINMRKARKGSASVAGSVLPSVHPGQALFRYRLSGQQFIDLEKHLKRRARVGAIAGRVDQAAFVLWASEWFRRSFTGGLQRWADLGNRLGLQQTQAEWRATTDGGLAYWGIAPLRLHGATQRLLHLARQGGFPTAAIEEANGWAARYLENLVGVLLDIDAPTADLAFDFAEGLQHVLPDSWRHEDFFLVSADLALAVVRLRAEAQQSGMIGSLPASVWLDRHRPAWRSELPLVVDSDAARTLIDGLMKVELIRGGTGRVGVDRWLALVGGTWIPRIGLNLSGELRQTQLKGLSGEWNRLRMFAAGQMAAFVKGELAIVEPDAEEHWLARPSKASALLPLTLTIPAEVELRGGGERIGPVMLLGNGTPVLSPLLVLQPSDDDANFEPKTLRIVGSGSGGYVADPLYVLAPHSWSVTPDAEASSAERRELSADGRQLWKVRGTVTVLTAEADIYLIRSGQDRDKKDRLILVGDRLPMADGPDGQEVFLGSPTFFLKEDHRERSSRHGDIWWRPVGSRVWQLDGAGKMLGACEFAWRDVATGHIRDRAVAIVLPADFVVTLPGRSGTAQLALSGWPGQAILGGEVGNAWSIGDGQSLPATATIVLRGQAVSPFQLQLRLPRRTGIGSWDGKVADNRKVLALADLHHYLAVAQGRHRLTARLRNGAKQYVEQGERRWHFDDELPLTAIYDDLAAMLRPLGDLDATVELSIDGSASIWYVSEFAAGFRPLQDSLVLTSTVRSDNIRLIARPLHAAATEHDLGPVESEADWIGIDRRTLPSQGAWLIYLRSDDNVLTRPFLHVAEALDDQPQTELSAVMSGRDHAARQAAVAALCDRMETGSMSDAAFDDVLGLIENLNGLPPASFDVIVAAFKRPLLAVRLLFRASTRQCPLVLALENGLPFSWSCIPKTCWDRVAEDHFSTILALLPETMDTRLELAVGAVSSARRAIREWEPELAPLLDLAPPVGRLFDSAQGFVQRAHDRALGFGASPFRRELASSLPAWRFDDEFFRALDAPCAAALAARGTVQLSSLQLRCVKDVARRHPRYFLEAFAAYFKDPSVV